jgi:tetratricopeptide (TPR) repeat protein
MFHIAACALLMAAFAPATVLAQAYPAAAPVVRTVAPAQLDAIARDREVAERFARGLDAAAHADWRTSAAEFTRVVSLDPPEPRGSTAQYDLGIAQAHLGAYAPAEAAFEEALRRDPGFAAAAANLVETALQAGDVARARSAADRFVAIAPSSLRARYSRGLVALKQNDLATARADFAALTAAAPSYALAHYDLAVADIRSGDYATAQTELQSALALSPSYARARFALATLNVRSDRRAEASANLARVIQDADDPSLRALAVSLRDRLNGNQQ